MTSLGNGSYVVESLEAHTEIEVKIQDGDVSQEVVLPIDSEESTEPLALSEGENDIGIEIKAYRPNLILELLFDELGAQSVSFQYGSGSMMMSGKLFELSEGHLGISESAVRMDSVDAEILLTQDQMNTEGFVIELWFTSECITQCGLFWTQQEDVNNPGQFVDAGRFGLIYNGLTQVAVMSENGMDVMNSADAITADTWYHLVLQYKHGEKAQFYLNGVLEAESLFEVPVNTLPVAKIIPGSTLEIEANLESGYFDGSFSELRIWQEPLSESEILELYQAK